MYVYNYPKTQDQSRQNVHLPAIIYYVNPTKSWGEISTIVSQHQTCPTANLYTKTSENILQIMPRHFKQKSKTAFPMLTRV